MSRVAIITCKALGDSLIYLVLANNLQRNGYHVTFYQDWIAQLQPWAPHLELLSYPTAEQLEDTLAQYDIVIADATSPLVDGHTPEDYPKLAQRYLFMKLTRFHPDLTAKHTHPLAPCAGVVVSAIHRKHSMVQNMVTLCRDSLRLKDVVDQTGLTAPVDLKFRKHEKRIAIHPTSGHAPKNWTPKKFIALAHRLKTEGWQPEFTVSPNEQDAWRQQLQGEFPLPTFPSIHALAAYLYESGWMIGNDSGTGHLSSLLGLKTLIIRSRPDPHYRWRVGWTPGALIAPRFSIKLNHQHDYWQPFLSVKKVLAEFKQLVNGV